MSLAGLQTRSPFCELLSLQQQSLWLWNRPSSVKGKHNAHLYYVVHITIDQVQVTVDLELEMVG
jgi:hypothetical protein